MLETTPLTQALWRLGLPSALPIAGHPDTTVCNTIALVTGDVQTSALHPAIGRVQADDVVTVRHVKRWAQGQVCVCVYVHNSIIHEGEMGGGGEWMGMGGS